MRVPPPPQIPTDGMEEPMSLPVLHCDKCDEPHAHDHMPGNRIFPSYRICCQCGWATPTEEDET